MTRKKRNRGGVKGTKAAPTSAVTLAPSQWDQGATGQANRHNLITEAAVDPDPTTGEVANPNGVKRSRRVDMLEVWHRKGIITTPGYYAAIRLRDAIEATQKAPGWPDNDRVQSSPKPDHAVTIQIDRLSTVTQISGKIAPDDKPLIWHCVTGGIPATLRIRGVRPYHGRHYEAGLQALADGLDRLASAMGWVPGRTQSGAWVNL